QRTLRAGRFALSQSPGMEACPVGGRSAVVVRQQPFTVVVKRQRVLDIMTVRHHLPHYHLMVEPMRRHELRMRAALDDPPVLHEEDEVRPTDGRQASGGEQLRAAT